jgi:hypothetical protein
MALWQALLVAFGGNAALLLVLGFLGRSLVSSILAKDIERFKATLSNTLTRDIESFKAHLQAVAVEHEVRFSKLHEKRAEVLAELYKLLVTAFWQVSEFASPMQWAGDPEKKDQYPPAINAIAAYFRFFDQHRIWLPGRLCGPLETFARELRGPAIRLGTYLRIDDPTPKTRQELSDVWDKAWRSVQDDIPKLRTEIEAEFRTLLGVTE